MLKALGLFQLAVGTGCISASFKGLNPSDQNVEHSLQSPHELWDLKGKMHVPDVPGQAGALFLVTTGIKFLISSVCHSCVGIAGKWQWKLMPVDACFGLES